MEKSAESWVRIITVKQCALWKQQLHQPQFKSWRSSWRRQVAGHRKEGHGGNSHSVTKHAKIQSAKGWISKNNFYFTTKTFLKKAGLDFLFHFPLLLWACSYTESSMDLLGGCVGRAPATWLVLSSAPSAQMSTPSTRNKPWDWGPLFTDVNSSVLYVCSSEVPYRKRPSVTH